MIFMAVSERFDWEFKPSKKIFFRVLLIIEYLGRRSTGEILSFNSVVICVF